MLLHELALFHAEFVGIVAVFLLQGVKLRLYGLHLYLCFAVVDVGEDLYQTKQHRHHNDSGQIVVVKQPVQKLHELVKPIREEKCHRLSLSVLLRELLFALRPLAAPTPLFGHRIAAAL